MRRGTLSHLSRDDRVVQNNWFEQGGQRYARFRPGYPPALAAYLASLCGRRRLAVDVGCGTGQITVELAAHFDEALGLDPSADHVANARTAERVRYEVSPAERLPLPAASVDLLTAAQAAHWFDLPAFYAEAGRVAAPCALLALVSYGVPRLDAAPGVRFQHFYRDEIGPYWPPERRHVDAGYADIDFPFEELAPPAMEIRRDWTLSQFLGYVSTWSAVRNAQLAGADGILQRFAADLGDLWQGKDPRTITWPLNMRLGRIESGV